MMLAEIRCRLYTGQFSSEYAVIVESVSGRTYSLFAHQDDVANDGEPTLDEPTDGWLRVKILKPEGNNVLVQLPQSTIENGSYLAVRRDQMRFSPRLRSFDEPTRGESARGDLLEIFPPTSPHRARNSDQAEAGHEVFRRVVPSRE